MNTVQTILNKALQEIPLQEAEITSLLTTQNPQEVEEIYAAARQMRAKYFGNKVFLYGFVYFSTYCKNNCTFCYYRAGNTQAPRYRKSIEDIVETAVDLQKSGIHLIDLTMGEDPAWLDHPEQLVEVVRQVKAATNLPIMVSPGLVSHETLEQLQQAGATWYALYQETHNKPLFDTLRLGQSYQARMDAKRYAKDIGLLTEEGLLTGVGDTTENALQSFSAMAALEVSQVRVMTFIPQAGTPMEGAVPTTFDQELRYIAVMRLLFPQNLIPASLDVDGLRGLESRLQAGANVVTSIIPPAKGYMGVAHAEFDVDEGYRTIAGIQDTLSNCQLVGATAQEYMTYLEETQQKRRTSHERKRTHHNLASA